MARHDHFSEYHYQSLHAFGTFSSLNPTTRLYPVSQQRKPSSSTGDHPARPEPAPGTSPQAYTVWRSRDNRKGRHAAAIAPNHDVNPRMTAPAATDTMAETLRGIGKMLLRFPIWDVSYDVAIVFTLGSAVWIINAVFVWLPLQDAGTEFSGETITGGGITAFIGATIFELGSILLMLEAVNENRADCFGWALEEAVEDGLPDLRPEHDCHHSHFEKSTLVGTRHADSTDSSQENKTGRRNDRKWQWWPSWYELRTHYFREIGFLACLSQMVGASVFWISGLTGLPPIYNALSAPALDGIYWLPQVIGGCGFIVSSWLFMLETQQKWYIPRLDILGWHIGFWNLVGAIGFSLCGAFGFGANNGTAIEYASTLATFIGSWAFMIASVIQWYESLDKYPISVLSYLRMLGPGASR